MTKHVHYYFAYGSNMNPARVEKRQMGFQHVMPGRLSHYRLAFNKRSVKYPGAASANVVPHEGATTEGVLYRLTVPEQIEMMDPFEGYPRRYNRLALAVETALEDVLAWVYVANQEYITEGLNPARWYLDHLLEGREYLSKGYYRQLQQTACMPDSELEPE
jgi:gamma-glutamylcyclotransferase (GGCT)/AIG2-like uncharacterized protein YtfP